MDTAVAASAARAELCALNLLHEMARGVSLQMLLVVHPQPHPKLLGTLNFCPLLDFEEKFQIVEEVFSWIDNENRVKEDSDFSGVSLALICNRNFSG